MKSFVLSLLLMATVFGLTLFIGCDRTFDPLQPVMEDHQVPEMDPELPMEDPMNPEGPDALTKQEAREKARGVVIDTVYAMQILLNPVYDLRGSALHEAILAFYDERTTLLLEKIGLTWPQIGKLVAIHLKENTQEGAFAELSVTLTGDYEAAWVDVVAKYLEITFRYPTKTEDEILGLFREYARDGETTVSLLNVNANYFSVADADLPEGVRLTDDGRPLMRGIVYVYLGFDPTAPEYSDYLLPEITPWIPELEPGKYRVKPDIVRGEQGAYNRKTNLR